MKKCMLILMLLFSTIYAEDWQEDWIIAQELCEAKDFEKALCYFNTAIQQMEEVGDLNHSHVYIDRGRLNFLLERNEFALLDFDTAINQGNMSQQEFMRAHLSRMFVRGRLGMDKGVLEDLEKFSEYNPNKPTFEKTEKHIIIRNAPASPCYQNIMTCYLIHTGQCLSKNDIKILKCGTWIIKPNCGCEQCKGILANERCCDHCGTKLVGVKLDPKYIDCCDWCDHMAIAATVWCGKTFRLFRCQAACGMAVEQIKKGCYWCCAGDGFYRNCVEPFERVLDYIKQPCDPQFD